jgi:hypothetical protein
MKVSSSGEEAMVAGYTVVGIFHGSADKRPKMYDSKSKTLYNSFIKSYHLDTMRQRVKVIKTEKLMKLFGSSQVQLTQVYFSTKYSSLPVFL